MKLTEFTYLILCVVVAKIIVSDYFKPAINLAKKLEVDNRFTRSPRTHIFTQFVLGMLLMPVFVVVLLVPSMRKTFALATERIVTEAERI